MKIQIHKNRLKKYFDMDWKDVPEFIILKTEDSNMVAVNIENTNDLSKQIEKFLNKK